MNIKSIKKYIKGEGENVELDENSINNLSSKESENLLEQLLHDSDAVIQLTEDEIANQKEAGEEISQRLQEIEIFKNKHKVKITFFINDLHSKILAKAKMQEGSVTKPKIFRLVTNRDKNLFEPNGRQVNISGKELYHDKMSLLEEMLFLENCDYAKSVMEQMSGSKKLRKWLVDEVAKEIEREGMASKRILENAIYNNPHIVKQIINEWVKSGILVPDCSMEHTIGTGFVDIGGANAVKEIKRNNGGILQAPTLSGEELPSGASLDIKK